ncbi:diaminopimelate epimerase [Synechococcus sp. BIOS-E4-1]|uniref:diaminopimelate epimerase n=1 Tax=Synechococcus sp. BIOS-E4-1 TaxID=1400864 RepID=UPI00164807AB|nr:diaminopimelate epimerase [Synechococcus sp. BIOS-E4-1]QNI54751.1 diaminopimelate epimerase [Synechococcus sp. BIOS-E4-1]
MLTFSKYQGLGNDFILMEGRSGQLSAEIHSPDPGWVQRLCDRRFGIGADGLILALPAEGDAELRMRIFNADGSEAEMCGNGIRCLARFLADSDGDGPGRQWAIETPVGLIIPELQNDGQIRVDMGAPFLDSASVPTTLTADASGLPVGELNLGGDTLALAAVGMGNPHAIVPVGDLDSIPFESWGAALECHEVFPAKTNVHFLKVHGRSQLEIRVWERGAGPTLACGTGACATLVAAVLLGLSDREATVELPGGPLQISWEKTGASVFMTGPAVAVFDGVLNPELIPSQIPATDAASVAIVEPAASLETANGESEKRQPDDACSEEEAQSRVQEFLASNSLDSMINIATESLEQRTLSRLQRDSQP